MKINILALTSLLAICSCSKNSPRGKSRKFVFTKNKKTQTNLNQNNVKQDWRKGVILNETPNSGKNEAFRAHLPIPKSFDKKIKAKLKANNSRGIKYELNLKAYKGQTYLYLLKNDQLSAMIDNYDLNSLIFLTPEEKISSVAFEHHKRYGERTSFKHHLNFELKISREKKRDNLYFTTAQIDLHNLSLDKKMYLQRSIQKDYSTEYENEIEFYAAGEPYYKEMNDHLFLSIKEGSIINKEKEINYSKVFKSVKENTFSFIFSSPEQEFVHYLNEGVDFKNYIKKIFNDVRISNCNELVKLNAFSSNAGKWHTNFHKYIDCNTRKVKIKNGSTVYFIYERNNSKVPVFKMKHLSPVSLKRNLKQASNSIHFENDEFEKNYLILKYSSHFYEFNFLAHFYSPQADCDILTQKKRAVVREKSNLYNLDEILNQIQVIQNQKKKSLKKLLKKKQTVKLGNQKYHIIELPPMRNYSIALPEISNYLASVKNICSYETAKKYIKNARQVYLSNVDAKAARNDQIYNKMETRTQVQIYLAKEDRD